MQPTGKLTPLSYNLKRLIERLQATARAPAFRHHPSHREDLQDAITALWQYQSLVLLEQAWNEPSGAARAETERQGIAAFNNSRRVQR